MHLVVLHGYLLQGTGSNIYVANIAKTWRRQDHAVTVLCQDLNAASLPFVDAYFGPDDEIPDTPPEPGHLRVITPDIGGLLPVYVFDHYEGFQVKTIPELQEEEIERHIELTASALARVAAQGVDRVLANHALLSPAIARRGLANTDIPFDVKIHGSAIEFVIVPHPSLIRYATEGLQDAVNIFVGTGYVQQRVLEVFAAHREALGLDIKIGVVPPGMDEDLFNIADDFEVNQQQFLEAVKHRIRLHPNGRQVASLSPFNPEAGTSWHEALRERGESYDQRATDADLLERWIPLRKEEPVILYFGKFLHTKGVAELLLTIPTLLHRIPEARFVFVGFGTYREHLEMMIQALGEGDEEAFIAAARAGDFAEAFEASQWFRKLSPDEQARITVTGILDHETLSALLPLASVSVVPSKLAEAFGMVAVEAMSAGVLPLCNYHSGLKEVVDDVQGTHPELATLMTLDPKRLLPSLVEQISASLHYLYPDGFDDHSRQHEIGTALRNFAIEHYSWDRIAKRLLAPIRS